MADFTAYKQPVAANEKARLIGEALDTLRVAHAMDERESLDRASWAAWYDTTIPDVRDLKILAGAMEIELHRRRGEVGVTHRVTRDQEAERQQLARDRALAAQPDRVAAFIRHEAAAGRVPSVRGAVRAARTTVSPTDPQRSQFEGQRARSRRIALDYVNKLDVLADGARRTDAQVIAIVGTDDVHAFLQRICLIPWLSIDRTVAGTTFVVDHDLRAICEGRAPRPALGHQSIRAYLQSLRHEIARRRKENHDEFRKRNWNSELILKREQTSLLDWIEEQLNQVPN
jgi:hypothetical protein